MTERKWHVVPLSSLHEDPANARKHGDRNRATVRASLQEFGQVQVLVVESGTGRVIGGNCTLGECRALGMEEVMVCEVDLHGKDAGRLAAVLNRSAELAGWDDDALADLFRYLGDDALNLGWSEEELEALLAPPEPPQPPGADSPDQSDLLEDKFRILVECATEGEQLNLLDRFEKEGIRCRAYML